MRLYICPAASASSKADQLAAAVARLQRYKAAATNRRIHAIRKAQNAKAVVARIGRQLACTLEAMDTAAAAAAAMHEQDVATDGAWACWSRNQIQTLDKLLARLTAREYELADKVCSLIRRDYVVS